MSNKLLPANENALTVNSLQEAMDYGKLMFESGIFKKESIQNAQQASVKIIFGQRLGLGPVQSLQSIDFIDGQVSIRSTQMAAFVKNHPDTDYRIKEWNTKVCTIHFFEHGEFVGESAYTIEDAKIAGLLGKTAWRKYPKAMLRNRAMSQGVAAHIPHVLGGTPVYTHEEMGADVDASGNVINVTPAGKPPITNGGAQIVNSEHFISSDDIGEAITDGDLRREWYGKQNEIVKAFYSPRNGVTFTKMIESCVKRYNGDTHAAKGAATKFLFNSDPPTGKTWQDGLKRVAVYRMVNEYAKFRDAGIDRTEAMQQVIEQLVLNEFNDDVLMMSPFVADLVGDYRTVYEAELSQAPIPGIEVEPAQTVSQINDDLFG